MESIISLFEKQVRVQPDETAVVSGSDQLSYAGLNKLANQVAHFLTASGAQDENIIAVLSDRSALTIAAIYGILKAGCAYLPIDPTWPDQRIRELVIDSGSKMMLTKETFTGKVADTKIEKIILDTDENIGQQPSINPSTTIVARSLAYVIYTSGSTGKPKGVMIEHGALTAFVQAYQQYSPTLPGYNCLSVASFSFDVSVAEIFSALSFGGCLHILNPSDLIDVVGFTGYITENNMKMAYLPPSVIGLFSEYVYQNNISLPFKRLLTGVEPLRQKVLQQIKDRMPDGVILNGYGPTETTVCATMYVFNMATDADAITPIGTALPGYIVLITEDKFGEVQVGETGQIVVGGNALARGYLNNEVITRNKFRSGIVAAYPNERFYLTGDLGKRLPDGNIEFAGRNDNQVKIKGYRVELNEIEFCLENHPEINKAAVLLINLENGNKKLAAFYTTVSGQVVESPETFASSKLPAYMVPDQFIHLQQIPLTSSDKTDRQKLALLAQHQTSPGSFTGNTLTDKIGKIYQEVLKTRINNTKETLSGMGGDSINAMEIIFRLFQEFGTHIPIKDFYKNSSIEAVSAIVGAKTSELYLSDDNYFRIVPRNCDCYKAAPSQHELYILHQLDESKITHNILCRIFIKGNPDTCILKSAITNLVNRYESFRLAFAIKAGELCLITVDDIVPEIPFHDFSNEQDINTSVSNFETKFGRTVIDPETPPLFRFTLIKCCDDNYYLYLLIHHIIFDGWSMGVFLEGLKEEYVKIKRGVESRQKPPSFGYIDYANWQNKMLESGAWEDQFNYWKKKLELLPEPLPSGRGKACGSGFAQARREWWLIPEHTTIRTKAKARESTTSVFVIMLSAWFLLLKKIYGQTDLIVTTPFANRNIPEVEKMTGYFTNMLVLRAFVNDNQKIDDLLNETSKMCLEAFSNSSYPFGKVIKRLGYNFTVDENPLLQIQFIMQNWNLPDLSFDGITLSQKEVGNNTAKAGLAMNVDQTGKGLECWIEYPEECFFLEEIRKMVNDYNEILVQVIDNPEKTVGEIISSQSVTAMKPVYLTGEGNLLIKCAEILLINNWKTVGIISDNFQTINSAKDRQIEAFSTYDGFRLLEELRQPHFLFSINNDTIIPGYVLSNQFLTIINYHNSLLPAYAGLFATSWAIIHNEKTHGITWHKVTEKIDAGDVYVQQSFEIGENDTAGVLNLKSFESAIEGFRKLLNLTRSNDFTIQPQNLVHRSYFGRYMRPEFACLINFRNPASVIERFCRACNLGWQHYNDFGLPRLIISGDLYLVPEVKVIQCSTTVLPGTILGVNALGIEVATAENAVRIPSFMGIDGSLVLPENIAQKHNLQVGCAINTANDQLLNSGENMLFRQIISNENFWLDQLLEYQPMVFPIFPSKKQDWATTEIAKDRFIHMEIVCENLVKNQPTEEAPLVIAQAVALFLAKLTDQSSIVLPVAFDNPVSQLVYPFVPVTFSFNKQESFTGQKDHLLQNLLSFKEKSGFFSDLFVRHPELKQKSKGSRFCDSNLAIVFQKGNSNSYTPIPGATTHIVIGYNSLTVVFPSISDQDITSEVTYLQTHLQHFISRLINPETPVCRLHLLTPDEWEEMIVTPSALVKQTDDNFTVLDLFNEQVKKSPSSIAVKHVGQELTYEQLDEMSSAAAKQLICHKFLPGSVAAIMAERSPALIAAMLGILKAGGAYLPLDASFPEARLDEIISGAGIRFALVTKSTKPLLEGKIKHLLSIENLSDPGSVLPPKLVDSSGTAYIIYTSGSTGQPKGVVVPHKALLAFTRSAIERYQIVPADKVLQFASLTFDTSVEEIFTTLCSGGTLVLRTREVAGSVSALLQLLQKENISVLDLPTAFWQQAISTMISEGLMFPDSIRLVIIGGEAVQIDAVNLWRKYFINGPRLINTYGPTEATVVATSCYLDEEEITTSFPIGKPMGNTTVFVVDSDYNPVLPVMKGQLAIGGPQIATKYLGDPALTNQKFIPDVFSNTPSNRIYLTGDLVTRNRHGSLIYLGRIDKQVKIRGFRVEPEEIDRVVALSGFTTASITVMKETNQVKRLVSYVIPKASQVDIKTILHKYLVQRLPEYMIPAAIVPLSALPFNRNMKVDHSALPLPIFDDDQTDENLLTPAENQLAGLFRIILKIDKCSTKTSFFDLGGDSLLSLALVSGIKQLFDYEISVAAIYEYPSIQKLALFIENEKKPSTGVYKPSDLGNQITCLNEGGNLPPIFTIFLDAANGWLPGLMSKQQPIFTFIPEGSDGEKIKHCTVPAMASFYVDSMLKLFPDKPVHLIGYSFGGLVALEMAIQLQRINIQPLSLTLIDTVAPQVWKTLINQIDLRSKVNHTLANLKRGLILFSGKNIPPSLRNGYILHAWRKAAYHYSPESVKDSMNFYLLRSKQSLSEKPSLGWEEWQVFTPEVTLFDGDHHSIIRHKEKVIQLAEWMKDKLY